NQAHLWKSNEVIHLVEKFLPTGKISVPVNEWEKTLNSFIMPLAREHKIDFDRSMVQEIKDGNPDVKLFLLEKGDYLVFQPSFSYKGYETKTRDRDEVIVPQGDIVFGDQKVSVAEVKRALANKQQFVQLNDGTLGILPEEWLKKYSLLFRVGEGKTDSLKLSRYHLSVVDELYETRDEEELVV